MGQSGTKWSKVGELSMLVGSYNHKLDSKGRTVLPARFRGELGSSIVATIGVDRCIALYPVSRWEELILKLKDLSSFKKKTRDFRRVLLSMATELEIDGSGRILIPSGLREYAVIDQEVTLIGLEDHLEIWDSIRWEEQRSGVLMDFSDLAEDLEGI
ncbi:Transcriptional regulator MraZ [bioreactor metagenome]|uniref:Transcriptional regulator MraZ n=1 Tax=bioreactor metagenome TaxID=1076179 RepID=A0A645IEU1_9ZZZZ